MKNITKIRGNCGNKFDYWSVCDASHQCKECKSLVCSACINFHKNKCVVCKTNNFEGLLKKCSNCHTRIAYLMCSYCDDILMECMSKNFCKFTDLSKSGGMINEDVGDIIICKKCK